MSFCGKPTMIVTTEAIILQSRKFSDSSKIVSAFTEQFGKVSLLAKGARSPKSKFGGSLEQLGHCAVTFYKKPNRDLYILSKAETVVARRRLSESYERLTAGLAIAEAIETSQEHEETNPALFRLMVGALDALAAADANEFSVVVAFQLRLAELMGFALSMGGGPRVGEPRQEYHFSFTDGTILSANDYRIPSVGWVFAPAEFAVLNALAECEMNAASRVEQTIVQKAKIHDFISRYFQFHIEKKMRYRAHTLLLG